MQEEHRGKTRFVMAFKMWSLEWRSQVCKRKDYTTEWWVGWGRGKPRGLEAQRGRVADKRGTVCRRVNVAG